MQTTELIDIPDALKTEAKIFVNKFLQGLDTASYTPLTSSQLQVSNEFKKADIPKTFEFPHFYDTVMSAWEEYVLSNKTPFGQTTISNAYPRLNINDDKSVKVLIRLSKRGPGTFSQQKGSSTKTFGDVRARNPILRERLEDSRYPGYSIFVLEQYFDNIVVFDIVANSPNEAEDWALFFEEFLLTNSYKWGKHLRFFRYDGMMSGEEFYGFSRQNSGTGQQQSQHFFSLRCEVGTIKRYRVLEKDLERFYITVKLSENDKLNDQPNRSIV